MQTTKEKIIQYIKDKGSASAKDIIDSIGISKQSIFIHLRDLLEDGSISKLGNPPKVFYILNEEEKVSESIVFEERIKNIINENFFFTTPSGKVMKGVVGFIHWCERNNLDPIKTADDYSKTLEKYNKHKSKSGLINGMSKIESSFDKVYLDEVFYLDFYAIERFGKTKLGQLLLFGKNSQDKKIIRDISNIIKDRVLSIVDEYEIDAVCFVPPTVKREVQLMKELENNLKLPLKRVGVVKIKSDITVPQKTLNKIRDRIENAEATFFVDNKGSYGNILIIDDAVGSGSTLNVIAKKIREAKINNGKIIGLAITGSFKGFDVISEV
ncbi:MAG: winged helix-turn-helix transcriptional regulator [Candidatus Pacebacteria bacterium]|nr:winged helix-turn-helix transcriptional regulator [Candidatus Paceibacterota bacterium]